MTASEHDTRDPFMLLSELASMPGVTRTAIELAIRTQKLTVISRHGKFWVHRLEASDWLSWRACLAGASVPLHQFEL